MDYNEKVRDIFGDDSTDIRDLLSRNTGPLDFKIISKIEYHPPDRKEEDTN